MLAGLVVVLMYQVYKVKFAPTEAEEDETILRPPSSQVSAEQAQGPPPPPADPDRPDTKRLVRSNPFSAVGLGEGQTGDGELGKPDAVLVRILPWTGGTYVAEIRTQTQKAKRFGVGEGFESFRVISINQAAQEVVIYSEEHRGNFTLTPEE